MKKENIEKLLDHFKNHCFKNKNDIQNKDLYYQELMLSHHQVLDSLMKLKKKTNQVF